MDSSLKEHLQVEIDRVHNAQARLLAYARKYNVINKK
jgi:hypothetical protein